MKGKGLRCRSGGRNGLVRACAQIRSTEQGKEKGRFKHAAAMMGWNNDTVRVAE